MSTSRTVLGTVFEMRHYIHPATHYLQSRRFGYATILLALSSEAEVGDMINTL